MFFLTIGAQGRGRIVLHDGTETERTGSQALHYPHHRTRTLEIDRRGVWRLAESHFQPEVSARDRLHRSERPLSGWDHPLWSEITTLHLAIAGDRRDRELLSSARKPRIETA